MSTNVEISAILSRPSTWYIVKRKTFIQCFEHAECIATDTLDVLGNELTECTGDHRGGEH